jgi:predicted HTH domain antitoxin
MNRATEKTALMVELPASVSGEEAQMAMAIHLFETGKLSLGQAARVSGKSKRAFIDVLGEQNIPVVNYPAEELESEIRR